MAIPIVVLFGPVLFTDRSFAMRDAAHFYHPLFEWSCREWSAGRVPLWNPDENGGVPVLADASSSVFYPGKLIFALPLDFTLRYKLYAILHVLLAAAASYWLARAWQASPYAAAVAAIAYACGGGVVFQYSNVVFLVGAAWLPFAALAIDRMLRGRSWRAAILLGMTLAMMVLGGDPQMALNAVLVAGLYAIVLAFAKEPIAETASPGRGWPKTRSLGFSLLLVSAAACTGLLLSAIQVLPSMEATKYSERAAFSRPRNIYEAASSGQFARGDLFGPPEPGHPTLIYDFSVGPWRWAEYFWPNIGGRMFPTHRRWFSLIPAEMRTWTPTLYLGLLPVILALSCWRVRSGTARQRWLSWLVLIFTLGSLGYYGLGWLVGEVCAAAGGNAAKLPIGAPVGGVYWLLVTLVPMYAQFRYPAKLLPLVSLGLAQLAAVGWDRAFAEHRPRMVRTLLILGMASGAAAFVVLCCGDWLIFRGAKPDSSQGPFDGLGAYRDVLMALVQTAVVALSACWIFRCRRREPEKGPRWQAAGLLLTAVELAAANYWLLPTAPAAIWRSESPVAAAIHASQPQEALPPRVYRGSLHGWRPDSFRERASESRPAEAVQWEHDTLFPKHHLQSGVSLVESYGSIKSLDHQMLLSMARRHGPRQPDGSRLPHPAVLRLLGAEFLVLPEDSQPAFAERMDSERRAANWPESTSLWKLKRTRPRAWIVHDVEALPPLPYPGRVADVEARTREVLFPGGAVRDFSHSAVVETNQPPQGLAKMRNDSTPISAPSGDETCHITRHEPQRVVIEATLARPGLVVLSDAWFPGWEATIRTKPRGSSEMPPSQASILRTNRVLRGVWLPAGKSRIEMSYRPATVFRGAAISAASWTLLAVLGLILVTQRCKVREGRKEDKERQHLLPPPFLLAPLRALRLCVDRMRSACHLSAPLARDCQIE